MPKVRRTRTKLHVPAAPVPSLENASSFPKPQPLPKIPPSLFANLNQLDSSRPFSFSSPLATVSGGPPAIIPPSTSTEVEKTIGTEGEKGTDAPQLNKFARRKLRHDAFLEKLHAANAKVSKNRKRRERKKKENQLSVNLEGFGAALEEVVAGTEAPATTNSNGKKSVTASTPLDGRVSKKKNRKARKNITTQEMARFKAVLQHPAFKSNPMATIQEHLRNTLGAECK